MDIPFSNLLWESIFDFGKWSNWKYANTHIFLISYFFWFPSSIIHLPSFTIHHPSSIIHHPLSINHHPSFIIHHLSSIIHHEKIPKWGHADKQTDRQTHQYHDSAWPKGQGRVKIMPEEALQSRAHEILEKPKPMHITFLK